MPPATTNAFCVQTLSVCAVKSGVQEKTLKQAVQVNRGAENGADAKTRNWLLHALAVCMACMHAKARILVTYVNSGHIYNEKRLLITVSTSWGRGDKRNATSRAMLKPERARVHAKTL